jgi:hypothetical protein
MFRKLRNHVWNDYVFEFNEIKALFCPEKSIQLFEKFFQLSKMYVYISFSDMQLDIKKNIFYYY